MNGRLRVASPLQLPTVSAGFAALLPGARRLGAQIAAASAAAVADAAGLSVRIAGSPRPARSEPLAGCARLVFAIAATGDHVTLDVDARFAARVVDLLVGGAGEVAAGLSLTAIEHAALELLGLYALDGAAAVPTFASLAPRLVHAENVDVPGGLVVDLDVAVDRLAGRARLTVPRPVVAALRAAGDAAGFAAPLRLDASLRRGAATLGAGDVAALAEGDVVLLDAAPEDAVVLPGGVELRGRRDGGHFVVEEARMSEWTASFPITLSIEIARATVALGDLAALERGGVLPLHVGREGAVTLRAGERCVARGQLVDVEGALGVRVDAIEELP